MEEPVLLRHGLWVGAELAKQRKFPVQFHCGFGDRDAIIHLNNPSLLMAFFEEMNRMVDGDRPQEFGYFLIIQE